MIKTQEPANVKNSYYSRHLIMLICCLCAILMTTKAHAGESMSRAGVYTVTVNTYLTVREQPSTAGEKIGRLNNNERISVLEINNGWAKISMDGGTGTGYVSAKYLSPISVSSQEKHFSVTFMPWGLTYRETLLYLMVIIFLLRFIGAFFFDDSIFYQILIFLQPALALLYVYTVHAPMWFCYPSLMGYIIAYFNLFFLGAYMYFMLMTMWDYICTSFRSFSVFKLLMILLSGFALFKVGSVAIEQIVILVILNILGVIANGVSKSGSRNSGETTIIEDMDGKHEVHETGFGRFTETSGSGKTWNRNGSRFDRIR